MKTCDSCGSENPATNRFCGHCGVTMALACAACGESVGASQRFCGGCGRSLVVQPSPASVPLVTGPVSTPVRDQPDAPAAGSQLRWVSVLFVDLVGFTPWSESQDAEDVRSMLSGYFEVARTVVGRYGGVVEKFIGDAVMAVWGATGAEEDDAERAVRAALELVSSVAEFGLRKGITDLRARAGVVTGQVASWTSVDEGLVAGDRVNTAARVQALADPGQVLVDEVTREASQAAVAFAPAGRHLVKGKVEPLSLWRALRVVANIGGVQRVDGLEAAFVGRDRELALVKDLFHAAAEGGRTRLLAVTGAAGVGKSRLGWEFEKYIDGLAASVWWHRGRCLSYGEGMAFWALAEMVRQRFDISEDESAETAAAKLAARLPTWVLDAEERAFVAPRLGVLVGAEVAEFGREELFAGWRLFLERLAESRPVVWLVEDLHWADDGLLDFVDYLLEWSPALPLFVLGFARPELTDRRPGWLTNRRNATFLHLDPLPGQVLEALLDDLVPGMPPPARARIAGRAEGIPLYAVETIRALVDRDVVVPREGVYRLVGDLGDLAIPATLTALLVARIDGLPPDERELLKGLAVLGGSFSRSAVTAVSDASDDDVEELLRALGRKEILTVRSDPLSPERGQYTFTQTMLRSVAYDTLTKRERKTRHLAVARHLRASFPDDGEDVSEAIASHYLDAYQAAATDEDSDDIRRHALDAFTRAGARAGTLGSPDTAERHYRTAAGLADDETHATRLVEKAAEMAIQAGRHADALALFEAAAAADSAAGRRGDAIRLQARIAGCLGRVGRVEEGVQRMLHALDDPAIGSTGPVHAELHADVGLALSKLGRLDEAATHVEQALTLAAAHDLPRVLARSLGAKGLVLASVNRMTEAVAMTSTAIDVARRGGFAIDEANQRMNLADMLFNSDLPGAVDQLEECLALTRRLGDGDGQAFCLHNLSISHLYTGRWDETRTAGEQAVEAAPGDRARGLVQWPLVVLHSYRGDVALARHHLSEMTSLTDSDDWQDQAALDIGRAAVATLERDFDQALTSASAAVQHAMGLRVDAFRFAWPFAIEAALALQNLDEVHRLLALVANAPPGYVPPYLRAQLSRYTALLHAAEGSVEDVETDLRHAITALTDLAYPYWRARAQLELATWLVRRHQHDDAEPLRIEARDTFRRLGAQPDLDTADGPVAAKVGGPVGTGTLQA